MKQVIFINENKEQDNNPVEFTHYLGEDEGWEETCDTPSEYEKIVYLGKCSVDGDMFAAYHKAGNICIYKGHLNSGEY